MNNMGREIMAALKRFQVGSDGDGVTVGGSLVVSGSTTANTFSATNVTASGNLTFTGTGNRITGDMSNATQTNRLAFQTSTANSATGVNLLPNGTSSTSTLICYGNSDPTNASRIRIASEGGNGFNAIYSDISGTGTYLPMLFVTGGSERMRIDTSGNLLVGTTSAAGERFAVYNTSTSQVTAIVKNNQASSTTTDIFQIQSSQAAGSGYHLQRAYSNGVVQFAVRGDGVVFAQNTTIQSLSDIRTKENVRDAGDGLQTVLGLRPVRFDFKEGFGNNRKNQLGFIAQEVEAVFPDAVDAAGQSDDSGDPYKSVGPGAMIPVLVKAIQELKAELDTVKAELATLKGQA
jgi:hypothetical protein